MTTTRKAFLWLIGIGVGAIIVVLLTPQTGWVARKQIGGTLSGSGSSEWAVTGMLGNAPPPPQQHSDMARRRAYFYSHPRDEQIQLAAALSDSDIDPGNGTANINRDKTRWQRLESLSARFPSSAVLWANALRFGVEGIHPEWSGAELAFYSPPSSGASTSWAPEKINSALIASFRRCAAEGTRIDPDNAYFPTMMAIADFAAHDNNQALADLHQAAGCSSWIEYTDAEVRGRVRLNRAVYGEQSALFQVAVEAGVLFPHYASIRAAARMALWQATVFEQHGDVAKGVRTRHDLMRVGELMRVQGTTLICNLVGLALQQQGIKNPGGVLDRRPAGIKATGKAREKDAEKYEAYLNAHGYPAEAKWAAAELAAGNSLKAVWPPPTASDLYGTKLQEEIRLWGVDYLLLVGCLIAISAAGLAGCLNWFARKYPSRWPPARLGLIAGALLMFTMGWLALLPELAVDPSGGSQIAAMIAAACIFVGALYWLLPPSRISSISALLILILTAALALLLLTSGRDFGIAAKFTVGLVLLTLIAACAGLVRRVRHGEAIAKETKPGVNLQQSLISVAAATLSGAAMFLVSLWLHSAVSLGTGLIISGVQLAGSDMGGNQSSGTPFWATALSFPGTDDAASPLYWLTSWISPLISALPLVPLVVLTVGLAAYALLRRQSPSGFLAQNLGRMSTALAVIIVLVYCGSVVATVHCDRRSLQSMNEALPGEGQYYARAEGRPWPGVLPQPPLLPGT